MGGKQDCSKLCPNCIKSLYNHQRRSRPWNTTKTQDLNLIFFNKSVIFAQICAARAAPAPGLPRAGAGRPRDARIEKKSQVQNFWRILKGAPCNLQADHRQIMGRSWAVSRIFPQLCPNCTKSLYNHQRRSGAQKRRGTFAYMATPYCDFTHFQYSFSAEGACFLL